MQAILTYTLKVAATAAIIVGASVIARRSLWLGALIVALPLSSMISITWLYWDSQDSARVSEYAKEIFLIVPPSLVFFVPFLAEPRTHWPFWLNFSLGVALLALTVGAIGWWRST